MAMTDLDVHGGPLDVEAVKRTVGATTYARGVAYARRGAVTSCAWDEMGGSVAGEVQGTRRTPYSTIAQYRTSGTGTVQLVGGTCSCPVGFDCKHVIALLVAASSVTGDATREHPGATITRLAAGPLGGDASRVPRPSAGTARATAAARGRRTTTALAPGRGAIVPTRWEESLRKLLEPEAGAGTNPVLGTGAGGEAARVGLQFELVLPKASAQPSAPAPRVMLRPVVPGYAGNWVRSGIAWNSLQYALYGRSIADGTRRQVALLEELLRMSCPRRSYGSRSPDAIDVAGVTSRRLWDLLTEMRSAGLPLLDAGRPARPVALHLDPAAVAVEVTREGRCLVASPVIRVDGTAVPTDATLLVGRPPHGVVWWDQGASSSGVAGGAISPGSPARLSVAALREPMEDTVRALLEAPPVIVPAEDEERFASEIVPLLRRSIAVRAADESVCLAEESPEVLELRVEALGGQRISLAWSWLTRHGAREMRRPVGPTTRESMGGLGPMTTLEVAHGIARGYPGLLSQTVFGEELCARAELDGMTAVAFLTRAVEELRSLSAAEVTVDDAVPEYREADGAAKVAFDGSAGGDGDWFDLTVSVSVDGEDVPFLDLFSAIAEGRSHLVLPSGTYFALDTPELQALAQLIAEARALQDPAGGTARVSRWQAGLWEELARLGVVHGQAQQWEASVRALLDASESEDLQSPPGLQATLRPYQLAGFNWLAFLYQRRLGGILADDMGLGKTLQALALICHERQGGKGGAPWLVIAPTSVVGNWAAECARFAPGLRTVAVANTVARRHIPLAALVEGADVVVTSYSLFRLEHDQYAALDWAGLFLDEAQFAKNHNSQTYQRIRSLPVHYKVAVTGTPMENNLHELWSMLSIAAPGLFPNPKSFGQDYRLPIERHGDSDRLDQLRRRIRPLVLRRTKDQVLAELPPKQEQVLELELDPKHRRVYDRHLQRERQKVLGLLGDMNANRFEILRSLTLLRQASLAPWLIDPAYVDVPSTKLDVLSEMVDEVVAEGHRVLIFSQFTRFLGAMRERLSTAGIDHSYLDGRTRRRSEAIERFRTGDVPIFLISLKAGGFGLNLTEADHCILLDPWWNPATEAQAVDRVHRIGQKKQVMVYRLVAKGTIEEKVMALKARKAALFANVIDGGGFESAALTAEDIRVLIE